MKLELQVKKGDTIPETIFIRHKQATVIFSFIRDILVKYINAIYLYILKEYGIILCS